MRTLSFICASLIGTAPALAQVHVEVVAPPPPRVEVVAPAPSISFAAEPPLVSVAPGVQVVRDNDEEIFFSGGWYWHAGPGGVWYRTHSWHGGWAVAPRHMVPMAVMRLPRGHYRHFGGEGWREQRREERGIRHEERGIRHEERAIRHEERREEHREIRHEQKAERHFDGHHGRRG